MLIIVPYTLPPELSVAFNSEPFMITPVHNHFLELPSC